MKHLVILVAFVVTITFAYYNHQNLTQSSTDGVTEKVSAVHTPTVPPSAVPAILKSQETPSAPSTTTPPTDNPFTNYFRYFEGSDWGWFFLYTLTPLLILAKLIFWLKKRGNTKVKVKNTDDDKTLKPRTPQDENVYLTNTPKNLGNVYLANVPKNLGSNKPSQEIYNLSNKPDESKLITVIIDGKTEKFTAEQVAKMGMNESSIYDIIHHCTVPRDHACLLNGKVIYELTKVNPGDTITFKPYREVFGVGDIVRYDRSLDYEIIGFEEDLVRVKYSDGHSYLRTPKLFTIIKKADKPDPREIFAPGTRVRIDKDSRFFKNRGYHIVGTIIKESERTGWFVVRFDDDTASYLYRIGLPEIDNGACDLEVVQPEDDPKNQKKADKPDPRKTFAPGTRVQVREDSVLYEERGQYGIGTISKEYFPGWFNVKFDDGCSNFNFRIGLPEIDNGACDLEVVPPEDDPKDP